MDAFMDLERSLKKKKAAAVESKMAPGMRDFIEFERSKKKKDTGGGGGGASSSKVVLTKPEEPIPEDCCGNDCPNCVWIEFWEELDAYETQNA